MIDLSYEMCICLMLANPVQNWKLSLCMHVRCVWNNICHYLPECIVVYICKFILSVCIYLKDYTNAQTLKHG